MSSKQEKTFEEQLTFLETITQKLESPDLPLNESLELYEQGLETIQSAQKILTVAQEKIDFLETKYASSSNTSTE